MEKCYLLNCAFFKKHRFYFIACIVISVLCLNASAFATIGEEWRRVKQRGELPAVIDVYTGTKYTARSNHSSVLFKDKVWIAGGKGEGGTLKNDVWYSADGESWSLATASANFPARKDFGLLAFNDKLWVIGGNNGSTKFTDVWNSTDGITWTQSTAAAYTADDVCNAFVVFDNKMWAFGYNETESKSKVFSTEDGVIWTSHTNDGNFIGYIRAVNVSDAEMVIVGGTDNNGNGNMSLWRSTDGGTWTNVSLNGLEYRYGFEMQVFNGMLWIFGGQKLDGVNVTEAYDILFSKNYANWFSFLEQTEYPARIDASSVIFKNSICMYGGNTSIVTGTFNPLNDIWSTSDCKNWLENAIIKRIPARRGAQALNFDNKLWLIGGYSYDFSYNGYGVFNDVWSSSDGQQWESVKDNAKFNKRYGHTSLVFNNKMWVIGGYDTSTLYNDVWNSTDGESWTTSTLAAAFPQRYYHASIEFDNKMWVIGGMNSSSSVLNDVWSSVDGQTWTPVTLSAAFPARYMHTVLVYDGKLWIIGGYDGSGACNDVWNSVNGLTWNPVTTGAAFSKRCGHNAYVYNNKMWIAGGYSEMSLFYSIQSNDVWSSTDGAVWTQEINDGGFPARGESAGAVFDNSMWILHGGDSEARGDIWQSANGKDWTYVDGFAGFSNRGYFSGTVFKNEMWITGGVNLVGPFSMMSLKTDAWHSANGMDWRSTPSCNYSLMKMSHSAVTFNDVLYLLAGSYGWGYSDEVISSSDGTVWNTAASSMDYAPRVDQSVVSFNNKMWLIGGRTSMDVSNEVWYSDNATTWTATSSATSRFSPRSGQASVVFDNKIWVIGGIDAGGVKNDVWSSADGETWTSATLSAAFPAREYHNCVVHDGSIWLFGGLVNNAQFFNDIWRSSDGITWTEVIPSKKYNKSANASAFIFDNKFWLVGGLNPGMNFSNDIYVSGSGPAATAAPASLDFGTFNIDNGTTGPLIVTISNPLPDAWDPLSITNVTIQNDTTGAFSFVSAPYTGSIAVDGTKIYSILFNPTAEGPATADLVFTTNDSNHLTITIPLSGNGYDPHSGISDWKILK